MPNDILCVVLYYVCGFDYQIIAYAVPTQCYKHYVAVVIVLDISAVTDRHWKAVLLLSS